MGAGGEPNSGPRPGEAKPFAAAARAPIFPLPNLVFFPHTFQPLHVFEPRYRALTSAVLERDVERRLIVMVLAHEERPAGVRPAIHRIGSLGRVEVAEPLERGRWNLVLRGLARVNLGDLVEEPGGYFSAAIVALADALPDLQDPAVARNKARFLLTARRYGEQVLGGGYPEEILNDVVPYPVLVNRAAAFLRVDVETKQGLLDQHDLVERARAIERLMVEQLDARAAVDRFEERRPKDPRAN